MSTEKEPELIGSVYLKEWQRLGLMPEMLLAAKGPPIIVAPDQNAIIKSQRMETWRNLCPRRFQENIDRAKIPNLAAWDAADKWDGSHPGLWLWSHSTGEAKSRMLWRKFGHLHVTHGKVVCRITGANLAEAYHDAFNPNHTSDFYNRISKYSVLMLDDLDKMALPNPDDGFSEQATAQRNSRMLREVFDRLYEQKTPTLVTANEPISWFAERIGESGARRMRETCNEIEF